MRQLQQFAFLSIALLACSSTTISQESARPAASDFNVELNVGPRPMIYSIPVPPGRSGYFAHLELKRVPDWKASPEVPVAATALKFEFWLEESVPKIEVTAYLGKIEVNSRPHEWKVPTAKIVSRALPPEETIVIAETERLGIQPIQVRAFRAQPWSVGPPEVTNKTQALSVIAVTEARPSYSVSVRNVSHKLITAIHWYGVENGRKGGGSGLSGAPVIPAGRSFVFHVHFSHTEDKGRPDSADKEPASRREIVIAVVVFDDGTFEGEADMAAETSANMTGMRIQNMRVIGLLKRIGPASGSEQTLVLKNLKSDSSGLSEDVDEHLVAELRSRFTQASDDVRNRRIKEEVEKGLRFVKSDLLREIERFEYRRENSPSDADFESWLKELMKRFGRIVTD